MFVPVVSKMIIALVWAFWMLSVDSSLGQEQLPKKVKNVWDDEKPLPEYHPTYGSTVKKIKEEGSVALKVCSNLFRANNAANT